MSAGVWPLVFSDGLYVVLQWIEQRRRETNEYIRQYADNMMKSFAVIHRRIRMRRGLDPVPPPHYRIGVPSTTILYGVPSTTRRGGWFQAPRHAYATRLYNHWIQRLLAEAEVYDNPDGEGSPLVVRRPYYFPGL